MEPYHKRKKLLEKKYGKPITLKPYSDDVGIADTKQQKFVKQLQDISDEEGLKKHMIREMGYISIIINIYRRHKGLSTRPHR